MERNIRALELVSIYVVTQGTDWYNAPPLSRGNSPTVFSIRKAICGRYGVCIVSSIVVVRAYVSQVQYVPKTLGHQRYNNNILVLCTSLV